MGAMSSELILRLRDGVTGPARIVDASLKRLSQTIASTIGNTSGSGISAAAAAMRKQAAEMRSAAAEMQHSTHAIGSALAGIGIGHGLREIIDAGADLNKEMLALRNAGNPAEDVARGIAEANRLITEIPTSSLAENIKLLNETTGAFGSFGHALENLEFNSKLAGVMHSTLGDKVGSAGDMFNKLVRAFEIRGTAFDPKTYQREVSALSKAFIFTRGNVNPESFLTFAQNFNPGIKGLSTEFLTEIAPSLIQTLGGDKAGTSLTAFEKIVKGGLTDKGQAKEWQRLGLISAKAIQDNKGQSPGWKSGALAGTDLALKNPLDFMEQVVLPAIQRSGVDIMDPVALGKELDVLFKNKRAQAAAYELGQAITRSALRKDQRLTKRVPGIDEQYRNNLQDLGTSLAALKASFDDVFAAVSGPWIAPITAGVMGLTVALQHLSQFLQAHTFAGAAAGLVTGLAGATAMVTVLRSSFALLGLSGIRPFAMIQAASLSLRATMLGAAASAGRGFLMLLNPLALVRGALVGLRVVTRGLIASSGIGLLYLAGEWIYENWSNVTVAFEAFKGAFVRALGPVRPVLQPIIDDIGSLIGFVRGLVQPTSDMGDNWARIGIEMGKAVGTNVAPWAGGIRQAYDAVKSLADGSTEAGGKLQALIGWLQDLGSRQWWDFGPIFTALGNLAVEMKAKLDASLTSLFTGLVESAKVAVRQAADAIAGYDWVGVGRAIIQAIIDGLKGLAGSLGDTLRGGILGGVSAPGVGGPGNGGSAIPTHVSPGGPGGGLGNNAFATPENADAIRQSAKDLGTTPEDLATVIGYETGGTYDPSQVGGRGNRYQGLIQFGPEERRTYGVTGRETFPEQMKKVTAYLKDRGFKPGMGLLDLYSTVNAGSPGHHNRSDRPGETVANHVKRMEKERAAGAREFLSKTRAAAVSAVGPSAKAMKDAQDFAAHQRAITAGLAGARARGGPIVAGRSYLVGERGPEILTAGASGMISANDRLRAAIEGGRGARGGGRPALHFAPVLNVHLHGGDHSPDDIGDAVVEALRYHLDSALESTFSDKD